jgi:hypothetical protein
MDLKPSNIKINKTIEGSILDPSHNNYIYNPLLEIANNIQSSKQMTSEQTSNMVDIINKNLKKQDHVMIYKMLRKNKSDKFFSSNVTVTHFNIKELDNTMKWELYRFVLLCKDNVKRNNVMNKANIDYDNNINNLNNKIEKTATAFTNETATAFTNEKVIDGVSEVDKFNNMLMMNN